MMLSIPRLTKTATSAAGKKAANLSVSADLLREAKELNVNLSRVFEEALENTLREHRRAQWLAENGDALEAYNRHVERDGVFSDGLRKF